MATLELARDRTRITITLANPQRKNALDLAMWRELARIFRTLATDEEIRCIVLTGAGADFAAGGDLVEMERVRADRKGALRYHETVATALAAISDCPVPVVARIQGACVGGGLEIAAACDLRIADETARFGAPINRLGFSMYPSELAGLLAFAGPAVVREILLEGRLLPAREAYEKGLVTRVVAAGRLDAEIDATCARILAGAPLVARWHKQWMKRLAFSVLLTEEDKKAAFAFLDTEDYREGMAAFHAKRPPRFTGR